MVDNDDRGQEDTVDLKDLDKMLRKLIESVDKLTEKLGKNSKAFDANKDLVAEHSEQTKKNKLEVQEAYFENLKAMAEFRKELKGGGDQFNFLTGLLKNGTTAVAVLGSVSKKLGQMGQSYDNHQKAIDEKTKFEKTIRERMKRFGQTGELDKSHLTDDERKQYGKVSEDVEKGDKEGSGGIANKYMSKMIQFADKHKVGIAIGAAGAGTLLKVLKMAFDASPMFQQVRKLLQFGVMMVLRPIGDFFGFLFRPIMIMLLRKFIIPWYTKLMPVMIHMGQLIGEKLSGAFEALAEGDVVKAFALLFEGVDFKKIIGDAFESLRTWITETDWDAVWLAIVTTLGDIGTGLWEYVIKPIGEALYDELVKVDWGAAIWDTIKAVLPVFIAADFIAGMFGIGNNKWFNEWGRAVGEWFSTGFDKAAADFSSWTDEVVTWFTDGLANITQDWGKIWDTIIDWLNPFSANKWGNGDEGSSGGGAAGTQNPVFDTLDWLNPFSENKDWFSNGGSTNNNQEINININAVGGNDGDLARDIKREVEIAIQESTRQGSPR